MKQNVGSFRLLSGGGGEVVSSVGRKTQRCRGKSLMNVLVYSVASCV